MNGRHDGMICLSLRSCQFWRTPRWVKCSGRSAREPGPRTPFDPAPSPVDTLRPKRTIRATGPGPMKHFRTTPEKGKREDRKKGEVLGVGFTSAKQSHELRVMYDVKPAHGVSRWLTIPLRKSPEPWRTWTGYT